MPGDSEPPDVRIAVPSSSSDSEDDPYLRSGPRLQKPDYTIIVPVTDALLEAHSGINVRRFLQTAVALAADNDGQVVLLGVETVPEEAALESVREYVQSGEPNNPDATETVETIEERRTQLTEMAVVAEKLTPDVPVKASVRTVTDVTRGILDVLSGGSETAVLLLRGTKLDEGWLLNRSTIETVLADAECNVFVENMGVQDGENALYVPAVEEHTVASLADSERATIDSVLLSVGTGPHSALAAEAARAVARAADAPVTVLHVVSPDASAAAKSDGEDLLEFAEYVLGSDVEVETELREAADTTDEIVQEAKSHGFVSIGAPTQKSRLEQLVFGSVQQTVSELEEPTLLLSRDPARTMRSLYYRWKRGIESTTEGGESGN